MTEMGIAMSLVETVRNEMDRHPQHRAMKVGLRLGEHAGIDGDALRFCFAKLVAGTALETLLLDIEDGHPGGMFNMSYLELEEEAARER